MTAARATLDHRDILVVKVILATLVAKATRAMTEVKVIQDQRVILDHKAILVVKVILDILAHKAILDQRVILDHRDTQVVKATLGILAVKVISAIQVAKVK